MTTTNQFFAIIQTWYGGFYYEIFENHDHLEWFMQRAKDSFAYTKEFYDKEEFYAALNEVEDDPAYQR